MNSKHLKGLAVVSIADGEKVGVIGQIFVDPADRRIAGFALKQGGGFLGGNDGPLSLIDVDDVHALGSDAMTLDGKEKLRGDFTRARLDHLIDLGALDHLKAVTEGGTYVGQVEGVEFDETSFRLRQVEISPGFLKSKVRVPIELVISIGHELIVVDDAVVAPPERSGVAEGDAPGVIAGDVEPERSAPAG